MVNLLKRLAQAILLFLTRLFRFSPARSSVRVVSPTGNISAQEVIVEYAIINSNSDPTDITVRYAVAGGAWQPAQAAANHPQHHGEKALSSSPSGEKHYFVWDWPQDIATATVNDVVLQIQASTINGAGSIVLTGSFNISKPAPPANQKPQVDILPPTGILLLGENIEINYKLLDPESDVVHIEVEYSADNGSTFQVATESNHPASEGTSGLRSSPAGELHTFMWKAIADLPTLPAPNVIVRVQSYDLQKGGSALSAPFSIGSVPSNHPPSVRIVNPQAGVEQASVVEVRFELLDDNSDPVRIEVLYSIDNGLTFQPATEATGFGSEGLVNLSSSPTGTAHSFYWKAVNDLPALPASGVMLQIQAFDGAPGGIASAGPFNVNANYPPLIQIFAPAANSQHGSPVEIQYVLTDREADVCTLEAFYSLDNGATFRPATSHPSGHGSGNLTSSATGEVKVFMWDAARDLSTLSQQGIIFKIQVSDGQRGGVSLSSLFDVMVAVVGAPVVSMFQPTQGVWGTPVPVSYQLSTPGAAQQLPVEMAYSLDNGVTFLPASEAQGVNSEGIVGLRSDPAGINHFFAWDAEKDIPNLTSGPLANVLLRVRSGNSQGTGEAVGVPFTIDSTFVGVAQYPMAGAGTIIKSPEIEQIFTPPNHRGIHVAARFLLKHEDNARVNVRARFSINGEPFRNATPALRSDQLTNLAAPRVNAHYKFFWNAAHDLSRIGYQSGRIKLELTPYVAGHSGAAIETGEFTFTIQAPPPAPALVAKAPLNALTIVKLSGDNQHIIAGQLPPESLVVELRDANNQVVPGARLTFALEKNAPVTVDFEEDPNLRTTTDYYGRAGIRVRPQQGGQGTFKIRVSVVGVPGVTASFTLESIMPQIKLARQHIGGYRYGQVYSFDFYLDIGQALFGAHLLWDETNPVKFKVTAKGAEVSVKDVCIPGPSTPHINNSIVTLDVTPAVMGGINTSPEYFSLKIEVLNLPGVQSLELVDVPVYTGYNAIQLKNIVVVNNAAQEINDDLRIYLKVISGNEADPLNPGTLTSQRAFPGQTLLTPFQVELMDGTNSFLVATDRRLIDCAQTPQRLDPLQIHWRAIGGVLSKDPQRGTADQIDVPVNGKVYFTPTGPAPWSVTASFSGFILDTNAQPIRYSLTHNSTNSAGNPITVIDQYCVFRPGIVVDVARAFFVHSPSVIGFEDVASATGGNYGELASKLKSGMKVRVLMQGLSAVTSNSVPEKMKLESILATGFAIPRYTGTALNFNQDIALHRQPNGDLRSDEIVIVQNETQITSGIGHGIIPLGLVKLSFSNVFITVRAAGLKRKRLRFGTYSADGDNEFAYESPVGTSPTGGALNSIILHNGEFVTNECDLSFPSRARTISTCRVYRSQVKSMLDPENQFEVSEPFGPGWFFNAGMYLEVAYRHLRFWDDQARYYDYPFQYAGKGQFIFITVTRDITDDRSAYEIKDRHGNVCHFNIDGTLRFINDRLGNKYRYEYNEQAQLVTIKDCMHPNHRQFSIAYYDDSKANRDAYLAGKIREIKDFENRITRYEYYTKAAPGQTQIGAPGFLRKVAFPESETVLEGSSVPVNFTNYKLFEYEANTRSGWRLKSITALDSKGNEQVFLSNDYDGEGRIGKQKHGQSEYQVAYSRDAYNNTIVEYKDKNEFATSFVFPPSAAWDTTTPTKITNPENYVTEFKYNHHGHLTYVKPPKGGQTEYVYDEDSQFARSRADLLALIVTSELGKQRITTHRYSSAFHFPVTSVGPEGNLPGADPELHTFVFNYDHQRNTGNCGNVVDSFGPRSLNVISKVLPSGQKQPFWTDDEQTNHYSYNDFGQITSHIDELGVKKEYFYYAEGNPTGGSIGPMGGGLLAMVKYDTETTPKRDEHLQGIDALPQTRTIGYNYNALGFLIETYDEKGVKTIFTRNKSGAITKEEVGTGVKGLNTITLKGFGPNGEVTISIASQAGTGMQEVETRNKYDQYNRLEQQVTKVNGTNTATITHTYDKGDRLETTRNSKTGIETVNAYDKRNLLTTAIVKSGTLELKTIKTYTENGAIHEVTGTDGVKTTYDYNEFGENVKTTNNDTGISSETILNEFGLPAVQCQKNANGRVISATEKVYDEYHRIKRIHQLGFNQNGTTANAFKKPAEYLGLNSAEYLSGVGEMISDDGFASGDGRNTLDLSWNIGGDLVQIKDDALGQYLSRFDGLGRKLNFDDRNGTQINSAFDDANNKAEHNTTWQVSDPLYPEPPYTFKVSSEYNGAGLLLSESDERNRMMSFDSDDSGKIIKVTNPENSETSVAYDNLNNPDTIEMPLTVIGNHSAGEMTALENGISEYNAGKMMRRKLTFDDLGRPEFMWDNAGNEFKFEYDDNQLKKVVYPASLGEAGYTYDNKGRIETFTAGGQTITYGYDDGRLSLVTMGQEQIKINYDDQGNVNSIEDQNDPQRKVTYAYNSRGEVTEEKQEIHGFAFFAQYQRDGVGRLNREAQSLQEFREFVYDSKTGKLKAANDQTGSRNTFAWYGDQLKHKTSDGIGFLYQYDKGLLSEKSTSNISDGDFHTTYEYDDMDRLTAENVTFNGGQSSRKYVYDNAGRVLKEELTHTFIPLPLVTRYFYDGDSIVRKQIYDEYDSVTDSIERIEIEMERNGLGLITKQTELNRTTLYGTPNPGPVTP
jgi:hypothetical protein